MKIKFRFTQIKKKLPLVAIGIACLLVYYFLDFHCPVKAVLGIPCMGCGMSSAYRALLTGDIAGAFSYHMMFWTPPVALLFFLFDSPVLGKKADIAFICILLAGFVVNWIIGIANYI